jgi:hypothetical protein
MVQAARIAHAARSFVDAVIFAAQSGRIMSPGPASGQYKVQYADRSILTINGPAREAGHGYGMCWCLRPGHRMECAYPDLTE